MAVSFNPASSQMTSSSSFSSPEEITRAIFADTVHRNEIVIFFHEGKSYPVRVINNKSGVTIFGFLQMKNKFILASKDSLPFSLEQKLSALSEESISKHFGNEFEGKSFFEELDGK